MTSIHPKDQSQLPFYLCRAFTRISKFSIHKHVALITNQVLLFINFLCNKKDRSSNFPLWNSCSILASQLEGCWNTHCFHTPFVTKRSSSHFKLTRRVFWGWDIAWSPRTWVKRTRWTSRAEARIESKTSHTKTDRTSKSASKSVYSQPLEVC